MGEDLSQTERFLTYEECLAWAERYKSTPWSMLALSTVADKQPSPMRVMRSLFAAVESARAAQSGAQPEGGSK